MLQSIESQDFKDWVEKVKTHLSESPQESTLLVFLRGFWQERSNWTKPPKPQNAARAYEDDQIKSEDELEKIANGTAYDELNEVWCEYCGRFHKSPTHE